MNAEAQGNKVNRNYLIFDKIEKIPENDQLYLRFDENFKKLVHEDEKVLLSCYVQLCTSFFQILNKKRKMVVTSEHVFLISTDNSNELKFRAHLSQLQGITKALLVGNRNFVIHYKTLETVEMISD